MLLLQLLSVSFPVQVVKEEYKKYNALLGLRQLVEFESDAVMLDIPIQGIAVKGWKITPLIRPVVSLIYYYVHDNCNSYSVCR